MDFSASRKSRLSAPQFQAQPSRLTDRSRLRRLKDAVFTKGAWQQVTWIEDLCLAQVPHKWLYHLDACAESVLTPHDNKNQRAEKTRQQSGWEVASADAAVPSWIHRWNSQKPAVLPKPRGGTAYVHAVVCGMNLADPAKPRNPGRPQLRNPGRQIFSLPLLSPGRSACVWPLPLQRQLAEMLHRRHSIVIYHITETKPEN